MTNLSFEQVLILLLFAIIGTIAVRFTFTFDFNRFIEDRRKRYIPKLQNACTHLEFFTKEDRAGFRSFFVSPSGTLQRQCQRCGLVKYLDDDEIERHAEYYLENQEEFIKKNKKFHKLLKKSGHV